MLKVYINYPNPHIMVHSDAECSTIRQQHKEGQRVVRLDVQMISAELIISGKTVTVSDLTLRSMICGSK